MTDDSVPFYTKYRSMLMQKAKERSIEIAHGQSETYADYKHDCGTIAGLNEALIMLDDLLQEYKLDD